MDLLLHDLVRTSASRFPAHVAVEDGDRRLTYAELDRWSDQVANTLVELGVSRGDRVGLFLDKSLEGAVGIYGILKCGAAYVPLDPRAPAKRLAYIAADCDLRVLITSVTKEPAWRELRSEGAPVAAVVTLDQANLIGDPAPLVVVTADDVARHMDTPPPCRAIGLDLAYILYTSGSTGRPKGVMLSHQNALAFVRWATETFEVSSQDRLSNHAPLHFDLSVFDLYAAAMAGATVVLVPPALSVFPGQIRDFIERRRITVWYSVPSILSMLTLRGGLRDGDLSGLRVVLFAGEIFPTKYLRALMKLLPHVRFCNLYGPTETNVCTWYDVPTLPEEMTEQIPIGSAIDDVEVFAITDAGMQAKAGESGELYVRGSTVMHGYWGDAERTARGLVPDPRGTELRDPTYRTGDLVRLRVDGDFELIGRRDHQIKSRGYRIELGEIEAAIYAHPDVTEAAVIAVPDPLVTNRLVAFVAANEGLSEQALTKAVAELVPHYMVPERIDFMSSLPKTSTGKISRRVLASLDDTDRSAVKEARA